jgi:hypothetical protein
MADTLVERLEAEAGVWDTVEPPATSTVYTGTPLAKLLREAADRIGLLTRSLEMMCKQSSNTTAQGDGSGE